MNMKSFDPTDEDVENILACMPIMDKGTYIFYSISCYYYLLQFLYVNLLEHVLFAIIGHIK